MTLLLFLSFVVFLALDIPIAFAMLLASIVYLGVDGQTSLIITAQQVAVGTDKYLLLAIPFFFLAAELMNTGGITDRLVSFARALVGHFRGGLGLVNVLSSVLFAGMSGSAVADAAGVGRIELELMRRAGYGKGFSSAITAASATIGPIIPPSIPLLVYAGLAEASVGRLFLAGVVPGFLMAAFLMASVYRVSVKRGYRKEARVPTRDVIRLAWRSFPVLLLPVIVLGGIRSGIFTPTESAIIAAAYAFAIGAVLTRGVDWRRLVEALVRVGTETGQLMLIFASASLFSWILTREGVPQAMAEGFLSVSREPWVVLLMINVLLLLLGCLLEPLSVMVVIVPILMPVINAVGVDPVHFGLVVTLNLMIGLITPPVGMVMFVLMSVTKVSMERFAAEALPFIAALVGVLLLITYVPQIVLFLPDLVMGRVE